jgi:hypothetical protein
VRRHYDQRLLLTSLSLSITLYTSLYPSIPLYISLYPSIPSIPFYTSLYPSILLDTPLYVSILLYTSLYLSIPQSLSLPYDRYQATQYSSLSCPHSCQSQWPRGLMRRSTAARLMRSRVRILPRAWTSVVSVSMLSGMGLCVGLITRPEESYRLCSFVVCNVKTS